MEHQKELFIQFMENNMPSEPFDPDKVLAAAREAVPDYQPSEQFTKGMDKLLQKSKRRARKDTVKRFFSRRGVPQVAVSLSVIICALFIAQANNGAIFDLLFQTHQTHTGIELTEQVREELLADRLEDAAEMLAAYGPGQRLAQSKEKLQEISKAVAAAACQHLEKSQASLGHAAALAGSLDPYQVLARGNAMVERPAGKICAVSQLAPGDAILLRGAGHTARCTVTAVEEQDESTQKF